MMKEGLGGHIKKNAFKYNDMRHGQKKEMARIERIRELQQRSASLVWRAVPGGVLGAGGIRSYSVVLYR